LLSDPDAAVRTALLLAALKEALAELPLKCRQVFIWHRLEGYTQQEIAHKLGISVNMVEKYMIRAARHLRHTPAQPRSSLIQDFASQRRSQGAEKALSCHDADYADSTCLIIPRKFRTIHAMPQPGGLPACIRAISPRLNSACSGNGGRPTAGMSRNTVHLTRYGKPRR